MKIWSDAFRAGAHIPAAYAFAEAEPQPQAGQGGAGSVRLAGNRNPPLAWSDVPAGTESLALFCIDGDAPLDASGVNRDDVQLAANLPRGDFFHWSLIDIPTTLRDLGDGALSDGVTPGGKPGPHVLLPATAGVLRQGVNDYSNWFSGDPAMAGDYYGYDGPCPPWNDLRLHHYIFRIYALDVPRLPLEGRFTCAQACAAMYGHIIDEAQLIATYTLNPGVAAAGAPRNPRKNKTA